MLPVERLVMVGFALGSTFPYGWLAVRVDFTEFDFNAALRID